jgi:hypothetical protein
MSADHSDVHVHDELIARLRARVDDVDRRVDERTDALTDMVSALPLEHLLGVVRDGGAALRDVVAANQSGEPVAWEPAPSGGVMVGGFDIAGLFGLMSTPVVAERRPPASRSDVARVEAALGVRLPALLVRAYTEVADGGFGPGVGLLPLLDRAGPRTGSLVDEYESLCEASEHGYGAPWPRHLVPIAAWSDAVYAVVDTSAGDHPVWELDLADLEDEDDEPWACEPTVPSLAEWLQRWVER